MIDSATVSHSSGVIIAEVTKNSCICVPEAAAMWMSSITSLGSLVSLPARLFWASITL